MSHRNYRGNPEIYIQQCKTPKKPGSIQQYFPSNKGVCIQPNRGAIQTNKLSYGHRFTTTSKPSLFNASSTEDASLSLIIISTIHSVVFLLRE